MPPETVLLLNEYKGQQEEDSLLYPHNDNVMNNEFYKLFLDERMVYSCAYFTDWANGIDQAQADVAEQPQHIGAVGEQPVQAVRRNAHRRGIKPPPALIAIERGDLILDPLPVASLGHERQVLFEIGLRGLVFAEFDVDGAAENVAFAVGGGSRGPLTSRGIVATTDATMPRGFPPCEELMARANN